MTENPYALTGAAFLPELQNALYDSESETEPKFSKETGPGLFFVDPDGIMFEAFEVTYDPENGSIFVRLQEA